MSKKRKRVIKKRRVRPTQKQWSMLLRVRALLAEKGYLSYPLVTSNQLFEGLAFFKKDSIQGEMPGPLFLELIAGGMMRIQFFTTPHVSPQLRKELHRSFPKRLIFKKIGPTSRRKWYEYVASSDFDDWLQQAGYKRVHASAA